MSLMKGTEVEEPVSRPSTLKSPMLVSGWLAPVQTADASAAPEAPGAEDPAETSAAGGFTGAESTVAG